jgi:hypothetical protein
MSHLMDRLNEAERKISDRQIPQKSLSGHGNQVVLALTGLFIFCLMLVWASEALSRRPGIALLLNPWNVSALLNRADASLRQDPPNFEAARRYAERALRADPLAPGVHRALAQVAEEANDESAEAVFDWKAARYARDGNAQFAVLQRSLAIRDFEEAANRVDLLFRGQAQALWGRIAPALANTIAEPELALQLARKLGQNPPWRQVFLEHTFARSSSVDALLAFYAILPEPNDAETRLLLERLVREGAYDAAHQLFLRMIPSERLDEARLLYNSRFQYGVSNLPFDWVITRMPNTLTEVRRDRSRRLLRVSFFGGRTPYRNVNHLMALAAGKYVLSGNEQAIAFNNPRGMRWRIFCTAKPEENLGASGLLAGDTPQRPFQVSFTVPPNCPFQILQLELAFRVALEQEATGSVVYSDLAVAAAQQ